MKKLLIGFSIGISSLLSALGAETLVIGVTAGPHLEIMEHIKAKAAQDGLAIKIIEFNDFILPNAALDQGDLDATSHQHQPFLDEQVKARGYKIVSAGNTILLPMGVYSNQDIKDLKDLKPKSKVAIPNDPTNGGRALLLLQQEGLIELRKGSGVTPSLLDITSNPKKLKFIELEAPQIPRSLNDVAIGVINTDWVLVAGMDPASSIAKESIDSPYANIIAVRSTDKNSPKIQQFVALYQTDDTRTFIQEKFGAAIIPAW